MAVRDFRKMLHRLSEEITQRELEDLRYLCVDFIPSRRREDLGNTMDFLLELERQEKLSETNLLTLRDLMQTIRREDLVILVDEFAVRNKECYAVWKESGQSETVNPKLNLTRVRELQKLDWDHLYTDSSTAGTMLRDVPANVIEELGQCLNPPLLKNWKYLAGRLGYRSLDVENFSLEPRNSTQLMLLSWQTLDSATVSYLYEKLLEIDRNDAAKILEPYIK